MCKGAARAPESWSTPDIATNYCATRVENNRSILWDCANESRVRFPNPGIGVDFYSGDRFTRCQSPLFCFSQSGLGSAISLCTVALRKQFMPLRWMTITKK
jgi:hypothetical protein